MSDKISADVHAKVLRAVRGAFAEGAIDRIEVRHLRADGEEARASTLTGDKISGKDVTPDTIAQEIIEDIFEDSKMFSGVSSYAILFFKPGEREYSRRVAIQFRGKADRLATNIEQTEPASEKGLVAMAMRNMESMMVRMNQLHETTLRHFAGEHQRLANENQQLRESHLQVLSLGQDLIDRKEERRIKIRREEKQDAIVDKGIQQVMMLAGPLLQKVLPGQTGQAVSTDLMTIQLVASLTPEQIQNFAASLDDAQRATFLELYGALRKRYEQVQIVSETPNGEKNEAADRGSQSNGTKEGERT